MSEVPEIHYLNTDLDLDASFDLRPLAKALAKRGVAPLTVHQRDDGMWRSVLEMDKVYRSPERNIVAMLKAIESLTGKARDLWDTCEERVFNVGYDCGDRPWAFNQSLKPKTLARMATLNAGLRITLYPANPPRQLR